MELLVAIFERKVDGCADERIGLPDFTFQKALIRPMKLL